MGLRLPKEFNRALYGANLQPIGELEIDWTDPITRGLSNCYVFNGAPIRDLVTAEFPTATGGTPTLTMNEGKHVLSTDGTDYVTMPDRFASTNMGTTGLTLASGVIQPSGQTNKWFLSETDPDTPGTLIGLVTDTTGVARSTWRDDVSAKALNVIGLVNITGTGERHRLSAWYVDSGLMYCDQYLDGAADGSGSVSLSGTSVTMNPTSAMLVSIRDGGSFTPDMDFTYMYKWARTLTQEEAQRLANDPYCFLRQKGAQDNVYYFPAAAAATPTKGLILPKEFNRALTAPELLVPGRKPRGQVRISERFKAHMTYCQLGKQGLGIRDFTGINNAPAISGSFGYGVSERGEHLAFSGAGGLYARNTNSRWYEINNSATDMSGIVICRAPNTATRTTIVGDWTSSGTNQSLTVEFTGFSQPSSSLAMHWGSTATYAVAKTSTNNNQWYVLTFRRVGSTLSTWVDGVAGATNNNNTLNALGNNRPAIGQGGAYTPLRATADVALFALWDDPQTEADMVALGRNPYLLFEPINDAYYFPAAAAPPSTTIPVLMNYYRQMRAR